MGKLPICEVTNRPEAPVYFNSEDFNGHQFLSNDAADAGYSQGNHRPDRSLVQEGVAVLAKPDPKSMVLSAEDSLLRILIMHRPARTTVRNMLDARSAIVPNDAFIWSCPEREWLFVRLISGDCEIQQLGGVRELRHFLSSLSDVPKGAFSKQLTSRQDLAPEQDGDIAVASVAELRRQDSDISAKFHSGSNVEGSLDPFFVQELSSPTDDQSVIEKGDLVVQEIVAAFLSASMSMKVEGIKRELSECRYRQQMAATAEVADAGSITARNTTAMIQSRQNGAIVTSDSALSDQEMELLISLHNSTRILQSATASAKRISTKLMDESFTNGADGRISRHLQKELASHVDDHMGSMLATDRFADDQINGALGDAADDEPRDVMLDRMANEWGDWFDDDYVWSPGDSSLAEGFAAPIEQLVVDDSNEESLEDFFSRVEREYKAFDDSSSS